jgi:hypothetical protein
MGRRSLSANDVEAGVESASSGIVISRPLAQENLHGISCGNHDAIPINPARLNDDRSMESSRNAAHAHTLAFCKASSTEQ